VRIGFRHAISVAKVVQSRHNGATKEVEMSKKSKKAKKGKKNKKK
jgi:hypothetical protein